MAYFIVKIIFRFELKGMIEIVFGYVLSLVVNVIKNSV